MNANKIFLTARWENLILVTFKIKPEMLEPYLPRGLEPDTIDGNAFVSLVAFDFHDTKVKDIKIPFHVNFPEINLRAYVKNKDKRGVIFIREFVPKFFISLVANTIYNEKYKSAVMESRTEINGSLLLSHTIKHKGKEHSVNLEADNKPYIPPVDSTEHFFKEHEWGFGTNRRGKALMYRVEHPFWEVYPIIKFDYNIDFGVLYGTKWESLNNESPYNITLAKGSQIKVFGGSIVK
jgi:uncharacterized protein